MRTQALNLGELIEFFAGRGAETIHATIVDHYSWRGAYTELGITIAAGHSTAADWHRVLRQIPGNVLEGYKGDYFMMKDYTRVYIEWDCSACSGGEITHLTLAALIPSYRSELFADA